MPSCKMQTVSVGLKSTNCFTAAFRLVSDCTNSRRAPVSDRPFITQPVHDALGEKQVWRSNSMPPPKDV